MNYDELLKKKSKELMDFDFFFIFLSIFISDSNYDKKKIELLTLQFICKVLLMDHV